VPALGRCLGDVDRRDRDFSGVNRDPEKASPSYGSERSSGHLLVAVNFDDAHMGYRRHSSPDGPIRHRHRRRRTSRAKFLAVTTLTLSLLVVFAAQSTASPSARSRPTGMPPWVPLTIDHPTPATESLPGALTETTAIRGSVISLSQADAVTSAIWSLRAQAFESDDRSLMSEFETGPALESDEVTCGCNTRTVRGPIEDQSLIVPKQKGFPAEFLAEVKTTLSGAPYVQYLVIARQSKDTPWEVVSDPGESETLALDKPKVGPDGFDDAATSGDTAKNLPSDFASYWQTWTEQGHAPRDSQFAAGKWTTKAGATYGDQPSGALSSQNGLFGYYSFHGGGTQEVWSFRTDTGQITCGVVRWQTIWGYPGGGIYQDPSQNNWGPSVAPGTYRYEAETEIMQPCFIQRPGSRVAVVSGLGDPDTEEGVNPIPAAPPPSTTPTSPSTVVPPGLQA
jgi:hypothetical protein